MPPQIERRLSTCTGEQNLARAMADMDENNFMIDHIIWIGNAAVVEQGKIVSPGEQQFVPRYLVIGSRALRGLTVD